MDWRPTQHAVVVDFKFDPQQSVERQFVAASLFLSDDQGRRSQSTEHEIALGGNWFTVGPNVKFGLEGLTSSGVFHFRFWIPPDSRDLLFHFPDVPPISLK